MKISKNDFVSVCNALADTLDDNGGVSDWILRCANVGIELTIDNLRDLFPKIQKIVPCAEWPKCGTQKHWSEHRKQFAETYTVPTV